MSADRFAAVLLANEQRAQDLIQKLSEVGIASRNAQDTEQLHKLVSQGGVAVIVIDQELPGLDTGLDILEKVLPKINRPSVLLLARPGSLVRQKSSALDIDIVLPPECTLSQIRHTVTRLFSRERKDPFLVPASLVETFESINPLPHIIIKLLRYLNNAADLDSRTLANDICADAKCTADLLRLLNSSAISLQRKVTNVVDAVSYLGNLRTITLLCSHGLLNTVRATGQFVPKALRQWYNHRSLVISSTAYVFAARFEQISAETACVLGLLQDIGILVMVRGYPKEYEQLLHKVRTVGQLRLEVVEQTEFGFNHAQVSAAVLHNWGLPEPMVSAVQSHHDPLAEYSILNTQEKFLHVMAIGECLANLTDGHVSQRYPLLQQRLKVYGDQNRGAIKETLSAAVTRASEMMKVYSMPTPKLPELYALVDQLNNGPIVAEEDLQRFTNQVDNQNSAVVESKLPRPVVMVVDDEPLIVELLKRQLKSVHLDVISYEDPNAFVELAKPCVAVLMDINMPKVSGIELIKRLRNNGYKKPIIVVSGDRTRETVAGCLKAGATDYLTKPIAVEALYAKISRHTGLRLKVPSQASTVMQPYSDPSLPESHWPPDVPTTGQSIGG